MSKIITPKFIFVFIILFALLGFITWNIFAPKTTQTLVEYKYLPLSEFNNYKYTSEFILTSSDIDVKDKINSKVYSGTVKDYTNELNDLAIRLGYTNKSKNVSQNLSVWTKPNINDLSEDYIQQRLQEKIIIINTSIGINSSITADTMSAYNSLFDSLKLPKGEAYLITNSESDGQKTFSYGIKWNNQKMYFSPVSDVYTTISVINNKIVYAEIKMLPTNEDIKELYSTKPLTSISSNDFPTYNFQGAFTPDNPTGGSDQGLEFQVITPVRFGMRQTETGYLLWNDNQLGSVLIPIFVLKGIYDDANNVRGQGTVLVVNQKG